MSLVSQFSVPRNLLRLVVLATLAGLVACGGDDGPTTPAGPRQISGQVTKGAVANGSVTLHTISALGLPGAQVAGPFTTDANGAWMGELAAGTSGPFLIVATGGSYTDEASGATVDLGSAALWGYSSNGSGQVTPFTHALAGAAGERIESGASATSAWSTVVARFVDAFGFDPTVLTPSVAGTVEARTYVAMLGGISELLDDNGALVALDAAAKIDLVLALAADLSDGALDGLDAAGSAIQVAVGTGTLNWPALDAVGIDALVDAINTYAAATAGLGDIVLSDIDLDFEDPPVGTGSGTVTFSGPGAQLMSQTTFVPASFATSGQSLAWSTDLVTFAAQIAVARSPSNPTRAILVTVSTVSEGGVGYGWSVSAFEGFVPGVVMDGNSVSFEGVVLAGLANTQTSLTLNGGLGE